MRLSPPPRGPACGRTRRSRKRRQLRGVPERLCRRARASVSAGGRRSAGGLGCLCSWLPRGPPLPGPHTPGGRSGLGRREEQACNTFLLNSRRSDVPRSLELIPEPRSQGPKNVHIGEKTPHNPTTWSIPSKGGCVCFLPVHEDSHSLNETCIRPFRLF